MNVNMNSTVEVGKIVLHDVKIGETKTSLEISNNEMDGHLMLRFECGYTIHIDGRGLDLQRVVLRPNHDHCNIEYLYENQKTGEMKWVDADRVTNSRVGSYELARMPFGPISVDW